MSEEIAITVKNLTKEFVLPHKKNTSLKQLFVNFGRNGGKDRRKVLNKISFEIKKGEFFGVVGRNGSGKSTLLKLLAGVYTPTKGEIHINGSLTPFIELGVGFNPELTGRENVFLNGALLGFTHKQMGAMYKDIVDFAELDEFMDQKLKNYSSGMQVRLAFSIAIRAKSDILLIDEVLAVGDANFQAKCFKYFRSLKKEEQTVVFISHDMNAIQEFCDRALLIDNGNIQFIGATTEVASKYMLDSVDTTLDKDDTKASPIFEFKEVKLGKPSGSYEQSETISFTIYYRIKKNFSYKISIGIQKNGVTLHACNTKKLKLPNFVGKHSITWEIPAETLLQGLHKINVAAFTKKDYRLMAYKNDATSFFIKENHPEVGGFVDIKGKWKVDS